MTIQYTMIYGNHKTFVKDVIEMNLKQVSSSQVCSAQHLHSNHNLGVCGMKT